MTYKILSFREPSPLHSLPLVEHLLDAPEAGEGDDAKDDARIFVFDEQGGHKGNDSSHKEQCSEGTALQNVLRTPPKQAWVPPSYVAEGGTVLQDSPLAGNSDVLKLICCCYEGEEKRVSIGDVLSEWNVPNPEIVVLIGPEGDFSREEVALALECGFR